MKMSVSALEAVKHIKSGDKIYIHSVAAAPQELIKALVTRANELENVTIYHLHTEGDAPYVNPEYEGSFFTKAFFVGSNVRKAVNSGRADYIPVFLSEVPLLFRKGIIKLDYAFIMVSPPDVHGYCTLGVSVDSSKAAVDTAKNIIAEINPQMPRTHGDAFVHSSRFLESVEVDYPIYEFNPGAPSDIEARIGKNVATLIEDGATLQMGIGNIPNAVLASLTNHKNLGIHTEMFSDGIIPLVESGVINGLNKRIHPGKIVSSFVMGTKKLYDFMNDNPLIAMLDVAYVNDTAVIRRNPKVTAINSAIEVDITGQVCADSIGTRHYSGVGGQMDFIRGASLSEGGKPIIALPSVTSRGDSRIVPFLKEGAGVVTTRAHVHYVATEHGVADLYGKSLKERAHELLKIADPRHQAWLEGQISQRFS
ncbi:acetyl-CoA hydrolase/transferase family protein [bacterium]|nr:MAG: acetyl-CoA hydrolase/transferase family protein [bacterium]